MPRGRVDADGQRFDPALHEAVAAIPVVDPKLVGAVLRTTCAGISVRWQGIACAAGECGCTVLRGGPG
jgi:hypothetical protein